MSGSQGKTNQQQSQPISTMINSGDLRDEDEVDDDNSEGQSSVLSTRMYHHHDYTVGIICAISLEIAATKAMFDEIHPNLENSRTDNNTYILGKICEHNVVAACLPVGVYGTTSASIVASQMLSSFGSVRFWLMVGIGGGAPTKKHDIRLGDVVVSIPTSRFEGVVQYDYGKTISGGRFERTGTLNKPPSFLLTAVARLRADHELKDHRTPNLLSDMLRRHPRMVPNFTHRGQGQDLLFSAEYDHVDPSKSCEDCCNRRKLLARPLRASNNPEIHYGLIASANQVMKHGRTRNNIVKQLDVLCFEMEAAGLMDNFPCLVIRGICDYADSHKNKHWQGYAAATASAYAKELLSVVPVTSSAEESPQTLRQLYVQNKRGERKDFAKKLQDSPGILRISPNARPAPRDRFPIPRNWDLATANTTLPYMEERRPTIFWLKGKAGSGKSILMKHTLQELRRDFARDSLTTAAYFFDASGTILEKSTLGLLRTVLYEIFTANRPLLEEFLLTADDGRYVKGKNLEWRVEELMEVFRITAKLKSWRSTIILVDALDEGFRDDIRSTLFFFEHLFPQQGQQPYQKLRLFLSSRHYPNITMKNCIEIWTESFNQSDIEMFTFQKISQISKTSENQDLAASIIGQADGVFLWVDLVTNALLMAEDDGEPYAAKMQRLRTTPNGLENLYTEIFSGLSNPQRVETFQIFKWVLYACRRLTPLELCFALAFESIGSIATLHSWQASGNFINNGVHLNRFIRSRSRGLLEVRGDTIQFIHQTVPEFLVRKGLKLLQPSVVFSDIAARCHHQIATICIKYLSQRQIILCPSMTLLRFSTRQHSRYFLGWVRPGVTQEDANRASHSLMTTYGHTTIHRPLPGKISHQISDAKVAEALQTLFFELPLLEYSVFTLQAHLYLAEESGISQADIVDFFLRYGVQSLRLWYDFQASLELPRSHPYHSVDWGDFLQGCIALRLVSCVHNFSKRIRNAELTLSPRYNLGASLSLAVIQGLQGVVQDLISCGADPNHRHQNEKTALDYACASGDAGMVTLLIQNGADIKAYNTYGFAAFHHAAENGFVHIVQLLLDMGVAVEMRTRNGETALLIAASHDRLDVFKLLIERGAQPSALDNLGYGASKLAELHRSTNVYAFLNPKAPVLPTMRDSFQGNRLFAEPISRAMTASPSPEKQLDKLPLLSNDLMLFGPVYANDLVSRIAPNTAEREKRIGDVLSGLEDIAEDHRRITQKQLEIQENSVKQMLSDKEKECLHLFRLTSSTQDATYE